jgi:hypothetical protein
MLSEDSYFVPTGERPMLARILHPSPKLCAFLNPVIESLSKPQRVHLRQLCDAVKSCRRGPQVRLSWEESGLSGSMLVRMRLQR